MADKSSDNKRAERTAATPGLFTSELSRRSRRSRPARQQRSESPTLGRPFSGRRPRQQLAYLYVFAAFCVLVGGVAGLVYQQKLVAEHRAEMLRKCLETFATGAFRTCRDRCGQFRATLKSGTDVELAETLSTLARECQIVSGGRGKIENYFRACRLLQELEQHGRLVFPQGDTRWHDLLARAEERVRNTLRGGIDGVLDRLPERATPEAVKLLRDLYEHRLDYPLLDEIVPAHVDQVLKEVEETRRRRMAVEKLDEALQRLANRPQFQTIVAALEQLNRAEPFLSESAHHTASERLSGVIEAQTIFRELSEPKLPPPLTPADDANIPIKWPPPDKEAVFESLRSVCLPLASGIALANIRTKQFVLYRGVRLLHSASGDEPSWVVGADTGTRWGIYRIRPDGSADRLISLARPPTHVAALGDTVLACVERDIYLLSSGFAGRVRLPEPASSAILVREGSQAVALGRSGLFYAIDPGEHRVQVLLPPVPGAAAGMVGDGYGDYVVICRRLVGGAGSIEVYRWDGGSISLYGIRKWQSDQPWSSPVFARGCVYIATKRGYLLGFRMPAKPVAQLVSAGEAVRLRPQGGMAHEDGPDLFRVGADTILAALGKDLYLFEPRPTRGTIVRRWQRTLDGPYGKLVAVVSVSTRRLALVRSPVGDGAVACEVVSLSDGAIEGTLEFGLATVEAAAVSDGVSVLDVAGDVWHFRRDDYLPRTGRALSARKIAEATERLVPLGERGVALVGRGRVRLFDGAKIHPLDGPAPTAASDCAAFLLNRAWLHKRVGPTARGLCMLGPGASIVVYVPAIDRPSGWQLLASSSIDLGLGPDTASGRAVLLVAGAPHAALLAVGRRGGDRFFVLRRETDARGDTLLILSQVELPGPLDNLAWVAPEWIHVAMRGAPLCRVRVADQLEIEEEQTPPIEGCVFAGQALVCYDGRGAIWAYKPGRDGRLKLAWNTLLGHAAAPVVLAPLSGTDAVLASYYAHGSWRGVILSSGGGQPLASLPPLARPVAFWHEGGKICVLSADGVFTHAVQAGQESN